MALASVGGGGTITPIKSPYARLFDASKAANPSASGLAPSPNVDYGYGTKDAPRPADPNAPTNPLPLSTTKPFDARAAAGKGGLFDYSADPILQQVQAANVRSNADAEANALAQRQQALIAYGYDPGADAKGLYGDASTAAAARANPFSTLANLATSNRQKLLATDEALNKNNLFYSSTRGFREGDQGLGGEYARALAEATGAFQGQLAGYASQLAGTKAQSVQNELAAEEAAYQRALDFAVKYGTAQDQAAADKAAADAAANATDTGQSTAPSAATDLDPAIATAIQARAAQNQDLDPAIATAIQARAAQPVIQRALDQQVPTIPRHVGQPGPGGGVSIPFVPTLAPTIPRHVGQPGPGGGVSIPFVPTLAPTIPRHVGQPGPGGGVSIPVFAAPAPRAPASPLPAAAIQALGGGSAPKPKPKPVLTPKLTYKGRH